MQSLGHEQKYGEEVRKILINIFFGGDYKNSSFITYVMSQVDSNSSLPRLKNLALNHNKHKTIQYCTSMTN